MSRSIVRAVLLVLALGMSSSVASAQERAAMPQKSGDIRGSVALCGAGSVEGTLVYIPGRNVQATLAANGLFVLNYVPVGTYTLVIHVPNRASHAVQGVVVADGKITAIPGVTLCRDTDNDGYTEDVDCNDNNPAVHPGAIEQCDGHDNDCNDTVDETCELVCTDADADGFYAQTGCPTAVDCHDDDPMIRPGAAEVCDLKDNNCDGSIDEGFDLQTDPSNCGACGTVCDAGSTCFADLCVACQWDAQCDDGNFCNGVEVCGLQGCEAGTPPCDDGIACTVNSCDEFSDSCESTPDNTACDDGLGNVCTLNFCEPPNASDPTGCVQTPAPSGTQCGDNAWCDGAGVCVSE